MTVRDGVKEWAAFKNQIFLCGLATAVIFEAGSLLFLGWSARFAYGLALGTAIAIVNFNILAFVSRKIASRGGNGFALSVAGYAVRLCVYGVAFYTALRTGRHAAAGAALGFLTIKIAVYVAHGVIPAIKARGKTAGEPRPKPAPIPRRPETDDPDRVKKSLWRRLTDTPDDFWPDEAPDDEAAPESAENTKARPSGEFNIRGKRYKIHRRK